MKSSILWFTLLGFARPALSIILLPLYIQYLTPEQYGTLALVNSFSAILSLPAILCLDSALRTFHFDYAKNKSELQKYVSNIFSISLLIGTVFFLLFLITGSWINRMIFNSQEIEFGFMMNLAVGSSILNMWLSIYLIYLRNELKLRPTLIITSVLFFATLVLQIAFFILTSWGVVGILLANLIPPVLLLLYVVIRQPNLITFRFERVYTAPSFKYALPLIPFFFILMLDVQLDRLILERHVSLEDLGVYALLLAMLGIVTTVANAIDNAIRPYLFKSLGQDDPQSTKVVKTLQVGYFTVTLLVLSFIILCGNSLHLVMSDEKYLEVQPYFTWGSMIFVPVLFTRYQALLFVYLKKSKDLLKISVIKVSIFVLMLLLFVPKFQIYGALFALGFSSCFNALLFYFKLKGLQVAGVLEPKIVYASISCMLVTLGTHIAFFNLSPLLFGGIQLFLTIGILVFLIRSERRFITMNLYVS